jgi:hypothetical protein
MERPGHNLGLRVTLFELRGEVLCKLEQDESCIWIFSYERFSDGSRTSANLNYCIKRCNTFCHRVGQIPGGRSHGTDSGRIV